MSKMSLAEILGLMGALGATRRSPTQDLMSKAEEQYLAFKPFEGLNLESIAEFNKFREELQGVNPEEVDTVFSVILLKSPPGFCEDCNTTHDGQGVKMMAFLAGDPTTLRCAISTGFREGIARTEPAPIPMAPSVETPQ